MKVLALDIATQTGCAFGAASTSPLLWSVDLGESRSHNARFAKAIQLTVSLIDKYDPDLVVIEAPVGGPKTSHLLVGLWACVSGAAGHKGKRVEKHDIAAIRKHFLGKHLTVKDFPHLKSVAAKKRAIKSAVINRCNLLGWTPPDDNAADAGALWDYACSIHSMDHHITTIGGLFNDR